MNQKVRRPCCRWVDADQNDVKKLEICVACIDESTLLRTKGPRQIKADNERKQAVATIVDDYKGTMATCPGAGVRIYFAQCGP
jgi:hypothetical protein